MPLLRSRARPLAAGLALMAIIGAAVVAGLFATGEIGVFRFHIDEIRQTDAVKIEISGTPRATYSASDFDGRLFSVSIPVGS